MGATRVIDNTVRPLTTITSIAPAGVIPDVSRAGVIPVGNYKGVPAFWDLDKAVNQPLVWAEQQHILGILDGREEDYDLQTLGITLAEAIGTIHSAALTVPAGQVWYVNCVETIIAASGGANIIEANWRCSLWTDRAATPSTAGQLFHAANFNFGVGGGTQDDEFSVAPALFAIANKQPLLRLPAGAIVTVTFVNTTAVAAATVNCTFGLHGFIGKLLVA